MLLQMNFNFFIDHQPHRTPENYPEHNRRSQEGKSATKDYLGKQQR